MTTNTTSRVGRKPIKVPPGVVININGQDLSIKGPKGEAQYQMNPLVSAVLNDGHIVVKARDEAGYCRRGSGMRLRKSIVGTVRADLANLVHGVTELFEIKLLLVGVGYKAQAKGQTLNLALGFSHPVDYEVPQGIKLETPVPTEIILKGTNISLLGKVASEIREFRPPELYKGKGVRYSNEVIILKETKKK